MPLPTLVALWTGRQLGRCVYARAVPPLGLRLRLRLQGALVPVIYAAIVLHGGLTDLVERWAPGSHLLQTVLSLAPLVLMELGLRLAERRTSRLLELSRLGPIAQLGPQRLLMTAFVLVPIVGFSIAVEILFVDRRLELFFGATALGSAVGMILGVLLLCAGLPLFFRWLMPTTPRLPAHLDYDLRATAASLGFRGDAILGMRTGHRMVNAAMVGPLPWPRYLVLTDGIMSLLDPVALRGVVAHEVGHAKAGHPAWLLAVFVVVPLLLVHPLMLLDVDSVSTTSLVGTVGLVLGVGALGLRALAHRFEFEADVLSAEALGGAQPCIRALRRVGELYPHHVHRASFRHPSEHQRIRTLLAWEQESGFRRAFHRDGRRLRLILLSVLLAAVGVSAWAQSWMWPVDKAVFLLYSGDFGTARSHLADLDQADVLPLQIDDVAELREEAEAAASLLGDGGEWRSVRDRLAADAWTRGLVVLRNDGPAAARPWFALVLSSSESTPLERCVYLYCRADADGHARQRERVGRHILDLDPPPDLEATIRDQLGQ